MQKAEDYETISVLKDEICCRKYNKVNLRFVLMCVLLMVVGLCVAAGLYHGIALKEYSNLALGLGIWLPTILLGVVCTCITVGYARGSGFVNQCPTPEDESHQYSQSNIRDARIKPSSRYQLEIDASSADGASEIGPGAAEYPPDYDRSKSSSRRTARSLSSSDITKYHHKNQLTRASGGTVDSEFPSRTNRSRQETREPRQKRFKRSVSESRICKYRNTESRTPVGNFDESACEIRRDRKDCESEEEEVGIGGECKYYSKTFQGPSRTKLHLPLRTVYRPDIYKVDKNSGFSERRESNNYTKRTDEILPRMVKSMVSTGEIYREGTDYDSEEEVEIGECEYYSKAVQVPSRPNLNLSADIFHRPGIYKENRYYSGYDEQKPRENQYYTRRTDEMPPRIVKSNVPTGTIDRAHEIHRESKDYQSEEEVEIGECKYYSKTIQEPSRTKLNLPVGTVHRPVIHRENKYPGIGEQEPRETKYCTRRTDELPPRIVNSDVPTSNIDVADEILRESKDYESEEGVEIGESKYYSKAVQGPPRPKLNLSAGNVNRPDIYKDKYSGFSDEEPREIKYYTRTDEMPPRFVNSNVPTGNVLRADEIYRVGKDYESEEEVEIGESKYYSKAVQGPPRPKLNLSTGNVNRPDIYKEDEYSRFVKQESRESKRYTRSTDEISQRFVNSNVSTGKIYNPETSRKDKYAELDKEELSKYKLSNSRTTGGTSRIEHPNFPSGSIHRPLIGSKGDWNTCGIHENGVEEHYQNFSERDRDCLKFEAEVPGPHNEQRINYDRKEKRIHDREKESVTSNRSFPKPGLLIRPDSSSVQDYPREHRPKFYSPENRKSNVDVFDGKIPSSIPNQRITDTVFPYNFHPSLRKQKIYPIPEKFVERDRYLSNCNKMARTEHHPKNNANGPISYRKF